MATKNAQLAISFSKAEASTFAILRDDQELQMQAEPLLRWNNPTGGEIYGDVYVWTLEGRPQAIASIYKWFTPYTHGTAEFQSLSELPLQMKRGGSIVWEPGPGVRMKPLEEAPQPAGIPFQRMRQMRSMAEQHEAVMDDREDLDKKWNLRLLPKPIYRYSSTENGIVDGALFAFCKGTTNDPEIVLMMEVQRDGESLKWMYAFGRQDSLRFVVRRNNAIVWDVPRLTPPWSNVYSPKNPYLVLRINE
ncbi:hypothetical protein CGZ80_10015 [Rhodopirellula sp. MGV]|nr:hypothetical protein CGZ80_10015 [Rhodopirellula sp. MGV]PNY36571.1 hypothetical protein C2E31_11995 [Rhodopirellula baltica]